jgi:diguanylate cyclase (GGDEF)-like protein
MISLRQSIDKLERDERRFRVALNCYRTVLAAITEHAVDVAPDITGRHRGALRTLASELPAEPEAEELQTNCGSLAAELADFRSKAAACHKQREEDLRTTLTAVAEAVGALATLGDQHWSRIKQFTVKLQSVARGTDLARMREEIGKQVVELRALGQSMAQENSTPIREMQARLNEFQARLENAEKRAATDALTGLVNRGEAETRLRRQVQESEALSVILIDLNGFKQINDRWGHAGGDQVLRSFAALLANNLRASDMVCRWGGDEFLVGLICTRVVAEQRAAELRIKLASPHRIGPPGRTCDVMVGASLGVAAREEGDSMETLLARADLDLYSHKARRKSPEPTGARITGTVQHAPV